MAAPTLIGSLAGNGTVTNNNSAPATLTAGGNNSSTAFSGTLTDGASSLGFTKTGVGTLILTGNNTYSGGTNLDGGIVAIDQRRQSGNGSAEL